MKRRGLSIRYKILLLLTLVPLITLALYLVLAVKVFEKDKLAYVFESTLSVSRTLSSQVTTEIIATMAAAKPAMQEFVSENNFGRISQAMFSPDGNLEWMAAFRKAESGYEKLGFTEKAAGLQVRDLQFLGDLTPIFKELEKKQRLIRTPFKDDRLLLVEKILLADGQEQIFIIATRLKALAESFRMASGEVYLVNDRGYILFGPADSEGSFLTETVSPDLVVDTSESAATAGTKEVVSHSGKELLASFSRTSYGDLLVVSIVDRASALKAVDTLIRRSIAFFILLISVSTIVSLIASGTLTSALTDLFGATKRVAEGNFDIQVKVKTNDEIASLADSFNAMASEVSRLMGETAEKARMESELKTAQTVQETLFPPTVADMSGFKIAGYYEPASECGGDWWHYCQFNNKVYLWIGDATGHGAPAALITSAAKSAATIIERLNVEPSHALNLLNRAIYDVSKGRIMMTFFLGCFDLQSHEFTYSNASHEAPFLIKFSNQPLKKKDLIPLNAVTSPRLGQERNTIFDQTTIKLDKGDRIFFYTDGIPDIENQQKLSWGEREFIKGIIATNQAFPPIVDSVQRMVEQFSNYRQKAPLKDDITFFMAHFEEESGDAIDRVLNDDPTKELL